MNRLREKLIALPANSQSLEHWLLALAYQEIGQLEIAKELLRKAGDKPEVSDSWYWTYGSSLRDRSVLLLLKYRIADKNSAWSLAEEIASDLSKDEWYSTQTTAWALLSIANTFGEKNNNTVFEMRNGNGGWNRLNSIKPLYQQGLNDYRANALFVRNVGDKPIHVSVSNRGVPLNSNEVEAHNGLLMKGKFTNMKGEPIEIEKLKVGEDFIAEVTVENVTDRELMNIALTQVVPSGWQIRNARLEGVEGNSSIDYVDIRDDRQMSYFSLSSNSGYYGSHYWWMREPHITKSVTVKMLLNASFGGRFYLPGWRVEPMYDGSQYASTVGRWVEVNIK
jgi:alpha-2-macroglobulin